MALSTSTERERGWFLKDVDVKQRYQIKTSKIGVCPYDIPPETFSRDRMKWPELTYIDIVNYLVVGCSWYTKEQMKHYKSLEAYKYFLDDWIRDIAHAEINRCHMSQGNSFQKNLWKHGL